MVTQVPLSTRLERMHENTEKVRSNINNISNQVVYIQK